MTDPLGDLKNIKGLVGHSGAGAACAKADAVTAMGAGVNGDAKRAREGGGARSAGEPSTSSEKSVRCPRKAGTVAKT